MSSISAINVDTNGFGANVWIHRKDGTLKRHAKRHAGPSRLLADDGKYPISLSSVKRAQRAQLALLERGK